MTVPCVRQSWVRLVVGSALLVAGLQWAGAEDVIYTQTQTNRGQVKAVSSTAVTLVTALGEMNIPRASIVKLDVVAPVPILKGIAAFEKGNYREAQINLTGVTTYLGLDAEWAEKGLIALAKCVLAGGDLAKAESQFNDFIQAYPPPASEHSVDAELGLAMVAIAKKDYETAMAKFIEVAEPFDKVLKPSRDQIANASECYLGMGKCLESQDKLDEALVAYLKVVALYFSDTACPEAAYQAAMIMARQNQVEKASGLFDLLIETYPTSEFAKKAIEARKSMPVSVASEK